MLMPSPSHTPLTRRRRHVDAADAMPRHYAMLPAVYVDDTMLPPIAARYC